MEIINCNIVIIGMPGCGKTTIGKRVAKRLNMRFCDIDHYIEEKEDRIIPDIFRDDGEAYFRKIEGKAVQEVSKDVGFIISTGGGVVKSPLNMKSLKKNGIIIFINRSVDDIISDIEIDGRPLLKDGKERVYKLYNERIDLYKKYCDYEIINNSSIEDIVNKIVGFIQKKDLIE